ncbi:MAG TPA: PilZ domain-containing protein [Methylobacterium sp.]|uniref:PilZ domain-containing protein n=1 Tax=Methylorubrum sp. B1-46 TaxID=2897334 RepID=UPI001E61EF71|nr:PilZ domain-containing protein [Methylorubrum sp. B1-46]UGB26564.1 PilZ domain-containing protein [Methylorubrum sp. B1-46]HEV2543585.1 PilZ domain-containing protein [Methylobacterium sp.]
MGFETPHAVAPMPSPPPSVIDFPSELISGDGAEGVEASLVARREERTVTNWIAMIRLFDGTEIPCNIKDISKSGAKLGVPEAYTLPASFMLRILGRDFVLKVNLAWRRGNYAGVRIERIAKLPVAEEKKPVTVEQTPNYSSIGSRRSRD